MITFPEMIAHAAEKAKINVPVNCSNYDVEKFPHWHVFCTAQLGQPMPYAGVHWDNAKVIASIPEEEIRLITFNDLKARGFKIGYSG